MSRRKIRLKKANRQIRFKEGVIYSTSTYPIFNSRTGKIEVRSIMWETTEEEAAYVPLYQRAHKLMPKPRSFIMDFDEHRKELEPSIKVLESAMSGTIMETDIILRALGILGHTPDERSISTLSLFSESSNSLADVARLALQECSSMYADKKMMNNPCQRPQMLM